MVTDWSDRSLPTADGRRIDRAVVDPDETFVRRFDTLGDAREYVREDGSAQIGGVSGIPSERVPALEHYRLVKVSETSAFNSQSYQQAVLSTSRMTGVPPNALVSSSPSWVKSFERVPGATVEGSGAPANANVTATVEMEIPTTNSTFEYTQRARTNDDGEFNMTVPYSTTDYDDYGPENGYTNVSVRANGSYQFSAQTFENRTLTTWNGSTDVSEGLVLGDEDGVATVDMQVANTQELFQQNETNDSGTNTTEDANTINESSTTDDGSTDTTNDTGTETETATDTGGDTATETAN